MLRFTVPALVVFQNAYAPRVLNRMTPDRMELTMLILKERKKKVRYLGSNFQGFNDRVHLFNAQGGVRRGTRYIIETHHNRIQFKHRSRNNSMVDVRAVKMAGSQYDSMGNYTRMTWDNSLCTTNLLSDPNFKRHFKNMPKEETIGVLEEWGVRYILLDEIRKPSLMDCKYHKHHLYADKFWWSPSPETNHMRGDAEFKWKGNELIAYGDYNAHMPHPANFVISSSGGSSGGGAATSKSAAAAAGSKKGASARPWFRRTVVVRKPQASDTKVPSTASKIAAAGTSK
ncbi:hypothetical protein conserved [Leishmania donovani]|uniref:Hypothetical_protein_conserved n=1 Tax=Leishmania donovani TaxID=5661 RepID=A0A504WYG8_LEIDO|nr:hypothetical protein CGC20_12900 [Leishmania donovani]CAJ1990394.1 hypothetical protein conserved [Leishmania donovani]VDZ46250.1 hypothetical_protein_conserved [Leishmania donovani]